MPLSACAGQPKVTDHTRVISVGMLEIARRDDGLRKVILYDATTREQIDIINAADPVDLIRQKISTALSRSR